MITLTVEREWARGMLSAKSNYRILVSGDMGPREIGNLIRVLTVTQEILEDREITGCAD